jgi:NADH-quinone oxidoreductase subunit K
MLLIKSNFLTISIILFLVGFIGIVVNRKNLIIMLMSIEIMLLGVNLSFITYSTFLDDLVGLVFVFFILTVAAAESAIGLAIIVVYFRVKSTITVESISLIKN